MGFHPVNFGLRIRLSVLELGQGTRQTDGQTDTGHHFIIPAPYGAWRSAVVTTTRVVRACIVVISSVMLIFGFGFKIKIMSLEN